MFYVSFGAVLLRLLSAHLLGKKSLRKVRFLCYLSICNLLYSNYHFGFADRNLVMIVQVSFDCLLIPCSAQNEDCTGRYTFITGIYCFLGNAEDAVREARTRRTNDFPEPTNTAFASEFSTGGCVRRPFSFTPDFEWCCLTTRHSHVSVYVHCLCDVLDLLQHHRVFFMIWAASRENLSSGFRPGPNRAVQTQMMARGLKFRI